MISFCLFHIFLGIYPPQNGKTMAENRFSYAIITGNSRQNIKKRVKWGSIDANFLLLSIIRLVLAIKAGKCAPEGRKNENSPPAGLICMKIPYSPALFSEISNIPTSETFKLSIISQKAYILRSKRFISGIISQKAYIPHPERVILSIYKSKNGKKYNVRCFKAFHSPCAVCALRGELLLFHGVFSAFFDTPMCILALNRVLSVCCEANFGYFGMYYRRFYRAGFGICAMLDALCLLTVDSKLISELAPCFRISRKVSC